MNNNYVELFIFMNFQYSSEHLRKNNINKIFFKYNFFAFFVIPIY